MITPIVSVEWLAEHLNDKNLILLDASTEKNPSGKTTQYPDIQIPATRKFDFKTSFCDTGNPIPNMLAEPEQFEVECQKKGINQDSVIVVYDNLGIYNSPRVWWMFQVMGHSNIAVLNGGLPAWCESKMATEPITMHSFPIGNFKAELNAALLTNKEGILHNLITQEALVIDARAENRFKGTAPEPREGLQSGHIPNAVNLPYQSVLKDGKFKSKPELIEAFSQFQIADRPLIFSCGSGITACILLLACSLAFPNAISMYDGSWSEWGLMDDSLIEKNKSVSL